MILFYRNKNNHFVHIICSETIFCPPTISTQSSIFQNTDNKENIREIFIQMYRFKHSNEILKEMVDISAEFVRKLNSMNRSQKKIPHFLLIFHQN